MEQLLNIKLVTPKGLITETLVYMAIFPGIDGDLAVLYGHENMLVMLTDGIIKLIHSDEREENFSISSGGVLKINNSGCTVLVESCELT